MSFVSASFLCFYLLALGLRFSIGRKSQERRYLLSLVILSLIFYSWEIPHYLGLIIFSCLVDYFAARKLFQLAEDRLVTRRLVLLASIFANLGVLASFKYASFISEMFDWTTNIESSNGGNDWWRDLVLPIGISFYTFQSMSYTIDVYRGQLKPVRFERFFLYVSFFPQLVAGPIVRAREFLYQLDRPRPVRKAVFLEGAYLIIRGLFLKIVVADNLGVVVDEQWPTVASENAPGLLCLSVAFFFSCQILCDFMAYTDIARGVAYQLGFKLPINFNAPYLAMSFSNFWKRWHISLSQWMRDYVYLSLGGNKNGRVFTLVNLIIVMLVSGLWHGASMNYLLWGGIHGVAIALERLFGISDWVDRQLKIRQGSAENGSSLFKTLRVNYLYLLIWFVLVQLIWIIGMAVFRSENGSESFIVLENIAHVLLFNQSLNAIDEKTLRTLGLAWVFTLPVFLFHIRTFLYEQRFLPERNVYERSIYVGGMTFLICTLYSTNQAFIYFKF